MTSERIDEMEGLSDDGVLVRVTGEADDFAAALRARGLDRRSRATAGWW